MSESDESRLDGAMPADASSVLLLAPSFAGTEDRVCGELLRPDDAGPVNVLWVTYTRSPETKRRHWREHVGGRGGEVAVIGVGEAPPSTSGAGTPGGDGGSRAGVGAATEPTAGQSVSAPVRSVSNPSDLTGLGIAITEYVHRWRNAEGRTVVCVDSVTAMLQYVDLETAFEFLHVVTGRLYATGGLTHFHMNPLAHDRRAVDTVTTLVDAVVELDEDAGPSVRSY